jgi:hypothetical protein
MLYKASCNGFIKVLEKDMKIFSATLLGIKEFQEVKRNDVKDCTCEEHMVHFKGIGTLPLGTLLIWQQKNKHTIQ